MAYPSRGAWRFRNATRGFDFRPTLSSIAIADSQEDLATLACEVVDVAGALVFECEDQVWATFAGARVFAGHLKTVTETQRSEVGPRSYVLEAQDFTAKLDDSVIDHPATRAAEPLAARLAWILTFLLYPVGTAGVDLPSATSEATEYDGLTVREALEQLAEEHRLSFYVDFDPDADGVPDLHLFQTESIAAPFALDDADPDQVSSFPYTEYQRAGDSVQLATAVYVQGESDQSWVTDATAIATYGRQERPVNDEALKTSTQRTRAGERALAENAAPQVEGSLVCWQPGLRAGMTFALTNALWGRTAEPYVVTQATIAAVDPHDAEGVAYLRTEIAFSDRRKAKASHRDATNRNTRKRARAALADATIGSLASLSAPAPKQADTGTYIGLSPFSYGTRGYYHVMSTISDNTTWPYAGCGIGCGGWGPGVAESEAWYEYTLPNLIDASWTGIEWTLPAAIPIDGVADHQIVGVAFGAPTELGDFVALATLPLDADGTVVVPRSMLRAGVTNYLVRAPAWHAVGAFYCEQDLGGGAGSGCHGPYKTGDGNSGQAQVYGITGNALGLVTSGRTPWVSGIGDVDGANSTFELIGWDGDGAPEARIGAVILSADDYTYDGTARTVTFSEPPPAESDVRFRYTAIV